MKELTLQYSDQIQLGHNVIPEKDWKLLCSFCYSINYLILDPMFEREKKWLKSIDSTTWFYFILLVVSLLFLKFTFSILPDNSDGFWSNVRVEFIGFCFDVLLLGLIFSIFMKRYQKKQDIKRWHEEIDDYRLWHEKEATHRIVGNIKRLNRAGVFEIDLGFCYLENAHIIGANLQNASFYSSCLKGATLIRSNFQGSNFYNANLQGAHLWGCVLEKANLVNTLFDDANLFTDLEMSTKFIEDQLLHGGSSCYPFLDGAEVSGQEWFEYLKKSNVSGAYVIEKVYSIIQEGERYILKVKPEKMEEYNYFKALSTNDKDERFLIWAKQHPELMGK